MADNADALPAPVSAAPARLRDCAECGQRFSAKREHGRFCDQDCRKAWNNRNTGRGGAVVPILQAWAATRHAPAGTREADINRYARQQMTAMARAFNDQDHDAGRSSPLDYVGALMDSASLYVDRAR